LLLMRSETDNPVRRVEVEIRPPTDDDPLVIAYEPPDAAACGEMVAAILQTHPDLA